MDAVAAVGLVFVLDLLGGDSNVSLVGALWSLGAMVGAASYFIISADTDNGLPPITLAAGSDNMVLVTGTPAAPVAKLVLDDNHAPALSTNVSMRLVNGLSGTTTGLSMAIDFAVAATNVLPGAASD